MQESLSLGSVASELLPFDGSARLHIGAFGADEARQLFERFAESISWREHRVFVFGRWVLQPRLTAWYGDLGRSYRYSGLELDPEPWSDDLIEVRRRCEALSGTSFNSVLANLYRTGQDSVAWHADDEPELGRDPVIASVSLGAERRFDFRHRVTGTTIRIPLPSGSVLVMGGSTQHHWVHQVAKTSRDPGVRINLTFRSIHG